MNNKDYNREDEIFKLAIDAFRKNVPVQLNIGPLIRPPHDNFDFLPDMELDMEIDGKKIKYYAEIKNTLTRTNIMFLLMHRQKLPYPIILIAKYVNPLMAEKLMNDRIEFIDTAGNAFINQPPIYIFVKGNRPPAAPGQVQVNRIFKPTGLKFIYALLCNPDLENKPFRDIAAKANVALGTVGWFMRDLRELGFLIDMGGKGYKLVQKNNLFQRWITAYPEQLRPKQILGHYKGEYDGWWHKKELLNFNAKWGGEVAAAKLTKYLQPEIITIYTKTEYLNQLLLECKLRKDPAGEIEILNQFWDNDVNLEYRDDVNWNYRDLVHPILIYADLIATGNQRNIEMAKMIYEDYIVRLIRQD
ncbi:MAG: type IV toxin-antitoxin system AbiEi family antitoxin [Smithella sp.]